MSMVKVTLMGGKHRVQNPATGEEKVYRSGDELEVSEATQAADPKRFQLYREYLPTPERDGVAAAAEVAAAEDQAAAIIVKAKEEAEAITKAATADLPAESGTGGS